MKFLCNLQLDLSQLDSSPDSTPESRKFHQFPLGFLLHFMSLPFTNIFGTNTFQKQHLGPHTEGKKTQKLTSCWHRHFSLLTAESDKRSWWYQSNSAPVYWARDVRYATSQSYVQSFAELHFCRHHVDMSVDVELYVYAHVYGYVTRCRTSLLRHKWTCDCTCKTTSDPMTLENVTFVRVRHDISRGTLKSFSVYVLFCSMTKQQFSSIEPLLFVGLAMSFKNWNKSLWPESRKPKRR